MSIENKKMGNELPKLEVQPANEIVTDPNHAWHAIRGYDFAGLEQILTNGLFPADNQGSYSVCLSASPSVSHSINREANSFYAYTLKDGLSLSVYMSGIVCPTGNHGGFVDELRRTSVDATDIDGIMLPSHAVRQRLIDISTTHEARKPEQSIAYIERTLQHLSNLGIEVDATTIEAAANAMDISSTNSYLAKDDIQKLEGAFMSAYARFLQEEHSISEPTVSDMLAAILDHTHANRIAVYAYDEALKKEISSVNARIAAKRVNSHRMGGMILRKERLV